jgi:hypothetical protein
MFTHCRPWNHFASRCFHFPIKLSLRQLCKDVGDAAFGRGCADERPHKGPHLHGVGSVALASFFCWLEDC